jgi:hypothetical protein
MFGALGHNIWDHEMPIRFGGIPLWHRMTVIRLSSGGLIVHSPTSWISRLRRRSKSSVPLLRSLHQVGGMTSICEIISTLIPTPDSTERQHSSNGIDHCHSQKFLAIRHLHNGKARSIKFMFKGSAYFWTKSHFIISAVDRYSLQTCYSI